MCRQQVGNMSVTQLDYLVNERCLIIYSYIIIYYATATSSRCPIRPFAS